MSTHPDINAYTEVIGELRQKLNACVLPITRCQRDHLLEQLGSDLLSITELTHQIMRVPVAALHICRQAGEAARCRRTDTGASLLITWHPTPDQPVARAASG